MPLGHTGAKRASGPTSGVSTPKSRGPSRPPSPPAPVASEPGEQDGTAAFSEADTIANLLGAVNLDLEPGRLDLSAKGPELHTPLDLKAIATMGRIPRLPAADGVETESETDTEQSLLGDNETSETEIMTPRQEAIDRIMQSLCASLDSKIAQVIVATKSTGAKIAVRSTGFKPTDLDGDHDDAIPRETRRDRSRESAARVVAKEEEQSPSKEVMLTSSDSSSGSISPRVEAAKMKSKSSSSIWSRLSSSSSKREKKLSAPAPKLAPKPSSSPSAGMSLRPTPLPPPLPAAPVPGPSRDQASDGSSGAANLRSATPYGAATAPGAMLPPASAAPSFARLRRAQQPPIPPTATHGTLRSFSTALSPSPARQVSELSQQQLPVVMPSALPPGLSSFRSLGVPELAAPSIEGGQAGGPRDYVFDTHGVFEEFASQSLKEGQAEDTGDFGLEPSASFGGPGRPAIGGGGTRGATNANDARVIAQLSAAGISSVDELFDHVGTVGGLSDSENRPGVPFFDPNYGDPLAALGFPGHILIRKDGFPSHSSREQPTQSKSSTPPTRGRESLSGVLSGGSNQPRQMKHDKGWDEDEGASDHDGRRKKQKRAPVHRPSVSGPSKKFACPYFKRNRKKYSKWTSCPGPGWDEVHRVKTHLYRRHTMPIQCPRCWEVFKEDETCRSHIQQNPPCEVRENRTLVEGFTKDQEKKLRSRKKAQTDTTDEDKWREIYMILFPDDTPDSIPSPYYDNASEEDVDDGGMSRTGELEDYMTFIRREMPTMVRRDLGKLFQDESKDVEERLRPRIAEIVLNLQPQLLKLYRQSQSPLSDYGPSNDTSGGGSDPGLTSPLSLRTGTEPNSTPVTDGNQLSGDGNFQFDAGEMFDFNAGSMGLDFTWDSPETEQTQTSPSEGIQSSNRDLSWDNEFDKLLNPALFMPQGQNTTSQTLVQSGSSVGNAAFPPIASIGQGVVRYGAYGY